MSPLAAGSQSKAPRAGPPVRLSLAPASGRPGTEVTVTGVMRALLGTGTGFSNLCWDGCQDGLQYQGVVPHWSSSTRFVMQLVVPAVPWAEAGPARVLQPVPGSYRIGVECLESTKGCGLGGAEGSATFKLLAGSHSPCSGPGSCVGLQVRPAADAPGDVLRVTGRAHLVSVIGSDQPFVFQLEIGAARPGGAEVTSPAARTRAQLVDVGHAALTVVALPSFASLGRARPLAETGDGLAPISANGSALSQVAWCEPGSIEISAPSGQMSIPTVGVAAALQRAGVPIYSSTGSPAPECTGLAVAGSGSGSFFASFLVNTPAEGGQLGEIALFTTDAGRTWDLVPVPAGATAITFGGFRYRGTAVVALFAPTGSAGGLPGTGIFTLPAQLTETTADGGRQWNSAPLSCPTTGPCLTFGPYLPGNCAMNGTIQAQMRSGGQGRTWSTPVWPSEVDACAQAQLAPLSATEALLADSASPYLLLRSSNAGETWQPVGLPALPGVPRGTYGFNPGAGGLPLLPDGAPLVSGQRGSGNGDDAWTCSCRGDTPGTRFGAPRQAPSPRPASRR